MKKNFLKYINHCNTANKNPKYLYWSKNLQITDYDIAEDIENNIKSLRETLGKSEDIIFREFDIKASSPIKAFICFIDGLVDKQIFEEHVMRALMYDLASSNIKLSEGPNSIATVLDRSILSVANSKETSSYKAIIESILSGEVALFIDGCSTSITIDVKRFKSRAIDKPDTEATVRGSREGFTETLRTNTSMLRRIVKNPCLVFEALNLGTQTNTKICIAYIVGIADQKLVTEVKMRLNKVDINSILESGYIEQLIDDNPFSLFSTIGNSERPDKIAGKLLEGRVAIICDGTPFVLSVPYLFIENFQVNEDYYSRPYLVSMMRFIRGIAFFITLALPALYIALETFHQEMIPTVLILTAAAAREGTPFPTFVEVAITEVLFLLLREAGIRMPRPIGQTVSFIGALVIGQSAVQAGILSAPMVIIGAITAIASFIIPSIYDSAIFFRYLLIILSSLFGFHGIALGLLFMLIHTCSLKSFGVPYLEPMAPRVWGGLKDSFIRFPLWNMNLKKHSHSNAPQNWNKSDGDEQD